MNVAQLKQAREIAMARLLDGEVPGTLVYVLYYPSDYELSEDGIMGLGTGLPPDTYLAQHGDSSAYYTLIELAEITDAILDH